MAVVPQAKGIWLRRKLVRVRNIENIFALCVCVCIVGKEKCNIGVRSEVTFLGKRERDNFAGYNKWKGSSRRKSRYFERIKRNFLSVTARFFFSSSRAILALSFFVRDVPGFFFSTLMGYIRAKGWRNETVIASRKMYLLSIRQLKLLWMLTELKNNYVDDCNIFFF